MGREKIGWVDVAFEKTIKQTLYVIHSSTTGPPWGDGLGEDALMRRGDEMVEGRRDSHGATVARTGQTFPLFYSRE